MHEHLRVHVCASISASLTEKRFGVCAVCVVPSAGASKVHLKTVLMNSSVRLSVGPIRLRQESSVCPCPVTLAVRSVRCPDPEGWFVTKRGGNVDLGISFFFTRLWSMTFFLQRFVCQYNLTIFQGLSLCVCNSPSVYLLVCLSTCKASCHCCLI